MALNRWGLGSMCMHDTHDMQRYIYIYIYLSPDIRRHTLIKYLDTVCHIYVCVYIYIYICT